MFTDIHCHPYDLARLFPENEEERRSLNVLTAASACSPDEFFYSEKLSSNAASNNAAQVFPCYGIHPQQLINKNSKSLLETLYKYVQEEKVFAIGECGFDLYENKYRQTEKIQEYFFDAQMEIALKFDLPVILHVRRAMHKIFSLTKKLSKCKAVIFHSWSGTYEEGLSLMRRGVNALFSFGNTIMLRHKKAIKSCALFPAERILTETDSPYQPRYNEKFSSWRDLSLILETSANLRTGAGNAVSSKELETQIENNFRKIFMGTSKNSF
jgi:TatD DNase family protein